MESTLKEYKQIKKTAKILPWFMGFTIDLVFYIAINTLFLSTVKGMSDSQISLLNTIPSLLYILLQIPCLKLIKTIGNKLSLCLGTLMLLLGSIIITFATSFSIILVGESIYVLAFIFKNMDNVILKNNLKHIGKSESYVKYKNLSTIIYSTTTLITSIMAGYLFNINHYIPMHIGTIICLANFIMSFFIKEAPIEKESEVNEKKPLPNIIIFILITYGIFFPVLARGQINSSLFIQHELKNNFSLATTAIYYSYIFVIARVFRMVFNILFYKIYHKFLNRLSYIFPLVAMLSFSLLILGGISSDLTLKILLMTLGFSILISNRDLYGNYTYNLVLNYATHNKESAVSYLELSKKIGETILGFIFSLMLIKLDMSYVIFSLIVLSLISLFINYKLYTKIK